MLKVIGFNTTRLYQADGQRISVSYDEATDSVLFNDHSRMISGKLKLPEHTAARTYRPYFQQLTLQHYELKDLASMVMRRYDHGDYEHWHPEAQSIKAEDWPNTRM